MKISNTKSRIANKFQTPMYQFSELRTSAVRDLLFVIWCLFGISDLVLVILMNSLCALCPLWLKEINLLCGKTSFCQWLLIKVAAGKSQQGEEINTECRNGEYYSDQGGYRGWKAQFTSSAANE